MEMPAAVYGDKEPPVAACDGRSRRLGGKVKPVRKEALPEVLPELRCGAGEPGRSACGAPQPLARVRRPLQLLPGSPALPVQQSSGRLGLQRRGRRQPRPFAIYDDEKGPRLEAGTVEEQGIVGLADELLLSLSVEGQPEEAVEEDMIGCPELLHAIHCGGDEEDSELASMRPPLQFASRDDCEDGLAAELTGCRRYAERLERLAGVIADAERAWDAHAVVGKGDESGRSCSLMP
eukprot:PLAT11269.1.p1 GENE.PLAT11269.1~~PLAT11269.1.p1  ORF type:complete len:235 (+),score=70.98 PLAT11269.1:2-706(+)